MLVYAEFVYHSIHASLRIIRTKTNQCKYMNRFLQLDGAPKKGLHDSKTKETTQKVMCIHFYLWSHKWYWKSSNVRYCQCVDPFNCLQLIKSAIKGLFISIRWLCLIYFLVHRALEKIRSSTAIKTNDILHYVNLCNLNIIDFRMM